MLKYNIKIMNHMDAFKYVYDHCGYSNKSFAIISIQEYPNEVMGITYKAGGHLKAALNIYFSDLDGKIENHENNSDVRLMTDGDALEIKKFVEQINTMNDLDELIIHCYFGASRSAAIAAAILKIFNDDDSQIFDSENYAPNMYVYSKLLNAFGLKNDGSSFLDSSDVTNNNIIF